MKNFVPLWECFFNLKVGIMSSNFEILQVGPKNAGKIETNNENIRCSPNAVSISSSRVGKTFYFANGSDKCSKNREKY